MSNADEKLVNGRTAARIIGHGGPRPHDLARSGRISAYRRAGHRTMYYSPTEIREALADMRGDMPRKSECEKVNFNQAK